MVIHPDCVEKVMSNISSGYSKPYEVYCIKKDETIVPVEILAHNIAYNGKNVRVAAIRDISDRKLAEKKIKEYYEKLELKNQELDEALIKAEVATRTKSEFLANMSHVNIPDAYSYKIHSHSCQQKSHQPCKNKHSGITKEFVYSS